MSEITRRSLDELLDRSGDLPEDRVEYSNSVRVSVGANEVVLDFFHISPNVKPTGEPQVKYVQRIILPLSVAKETGEIIIKSLSGWEETFGITLPFIAPEKEQDEQEDSE